MPIFTGYRVFTDRKPKFGNSNPFALENLKKWDPLNRIAQATLTLIALINCVKREDIFWSSQKFGGTQNVTYAYVAKKHKEFRLLSWYPRDIVAVILPIPLMELSPTYQAMFFGAINRNTPICVAIPWSLKIWRRGTHVAICQVDKMM